MSPGSVSNIAASPSILHLSLFLSSPLTSPLFLCFDLWAFPVLPPANARPFFSLKQEVLPDRKRVTTRSYLPITPVDTDSGSNFSCVASNPAVPMGKRATLTLNVHRMLLFLSVR